MKLRAIRVTYFAGGEKLESSLFENAHYTFDLTVEDGKIVSAITPKTEIRLQKIDVVFDYKFLDGDKFYSNGYQSWTTSREYIATDCAEDITPIAATGSLRNLAGISSDCRFVTAPKGEGKFVSHCYTYIKRDGKITLLGSLSERQGFTVFYADMKNNLLTLSKDVEGVIISDKYDLSNVVIIEDAYDAAFDAYFNAMGLKKPVIDHMSGYTSWYNYFQKIDEKIILRDLDSLDIAKESVSIFQIDDGYETFVGDWTDLNAKKFPGGMGAIAKRVHDKGYMAGIWLAPFNVQKVSRTCKEHPDWLIKDEKGKPILGCPGWGGAYTLDIYNAGAREYIKSFFNVILNDWGYDMVKLDFLYSQCLFPRNNKSRGTIMCEAMEFLRECCGDKLILGCGVPLGAAFGYVDACRISCDVDLNYGGKFYNKLHVNNEIPSAQNAINNSVFRRHLNGRAFCNDPDVFFLRYSNLKFNFDQKLLLAAINHICGDVLFVSDNAAEYGSKDIEVLKKAFSKSEITVLDANYETEKKIVLSLIAEGKPCELRFNIETGESNVRTLPGFDVK